MKTLAISRHAKSSWANSTLSDLERPLKTKGVRRANELCRLLRSQNFKPELIIHSPAIRSLSTARIIASQFEDIRPELVCEHVLYGSSFLDYKTFIQHIDNKIESVFITGHNPEISELASFFFPKNMWLLKTCGTLIIEAQTESWNTFLEADKVPVFSAFTE